MTVLIGMEVDENSGLLIADEVVSKQDRELSYKSKIKTYKNEDGAAFVGRTGVIHTSETVLNSLDDFVLDSIGRLSSAIQSENTEHRQDVIDMRLMTGCGVDTYDVSAGFTLDDEGNKIPVDEEVKEIRRNLWKGDDAEVKKVDDVEYLVAGSFDGTFNMQMLQGPSKIPEYVAMPYKSMGTGSDLANAVLDHTFSQRNENEPLTVEEGTKIAIKAWNRAASQNIGVGGRPDIKIYEATENDYSVTDPGFDEGNLISELVTGYTTLFENKRLLPNEFVDEAIQDVLKDKNIDEVEEAMWNETTNETALNRVLRGYSL